MAARQVVVNGRVLWAKARETAVNGQSLLVIAASCIHVPQGHQRVLIARIAQEYPLVEIQLEPFFVGMGEGGYFEHLSAEGQPWVTRWDLAPASLRWRRQSLVHQLHLSPV